MRRIFLCHAVALACAALIIAQPLRTNAAGDASAIRKATRTSDSRWVSNYRPGSRQQSYGRRSYYPRTFARSATAQSTTVQKTTVQSAPVKAAPTAEPQSAPAKSSQPVGYRGAK